MNIRRVFNNVVNNVYSREFSLLMKHYSKNPFSCSHPPMMIVAALDSNTTTCGLADRLKGMISAYAYAKAIQIPFTIKHDNPFELSDFLIPNSYDWLKNRNSVSMNAFDVTLLWEYNHFDAGKFENFYLNKQTHFYSNLDFIEEINKKFGTKFSYHSLYNELFQPSDLLQKEIDIYKPSEDYVSVSFRFTQLMGDFKDVVGRELDEKGKKELIDKCHQFIERIHSGNGGGKVLVTADSQRFINTLSGIPYIFTLPGEIGHLGFSSGEQVHLKTFLDFYMISKAKKVYMGYSGRMWKSKFAKYAAETTCAPYEAIQF